MGASTYSIGSCDSGSDRSRRASMPETPVARCTCTSACCRFRISRLRRVELRAVGDTTTPEHVVRAHQRFGVIEIAQPQRAQLVAHGLVSVADDAHDRHAQIGVRREQLDQPGGFGVRAHHQHPPLMLALAALERDPGPEDRSADDDEQPGECTTDHDVSNAEAELQHPVDDDHALPSAAPRRACCASVRRCEPR